MPKYFNVIKMNGKLYYTFSYAEITNYNDPYDISKAYDRTFVTLKVPIKALNKNLVKDIFSACSYNEDASRKIFQENGIEIQHNYHLETVKSKIQKEYDIKDKDKSYLDRSVSLSRYEKLPPVFQDLINANSSGNIPEGGLERLIEDVINIHNSKYSKENSEDSMKIARAYINAMDEEKLLDYLNKPFEENGLSLEEKYDLFEEMYVKIGKSITNGSVPKKNPNIIKLSKKIHEFFSADDGKSIKRFNALYALGTSKKYKFDTSNKSKTDFLSPDMIAFAIDYYNNLDSKKNLDETKKLTQQLQSDLCKDRLKNDLNECKQKIEWLNSNIKSNDFKRKLTSSIAKVLLVGAIVSVAVIIPVFNLVFLGVLVGLVVASIAAFVHMRSDTYQTSMNNNKMAVKYNENQIKKLEGSIEKIAKLKKIGQDSKSSVVYDTNKKEPKLKPELKPEPKPDPKPAITDSVKKNKTKGVAEMIKRFEKKP